MRRNKSVRRNKTKKSRGGAATSLPLSYFNAAIDKVSAFAGKDVLNSAGNIIRPRIEGGAKRLRHVLRRRNTRKRGGFVPTVMEGFSQLAAKYIVPLALFSGYKLLNNRTKKQKQSKKRSTRRRRN